ncbi:MAG: rod shape-determining protein MreC [Comamonas sp.]
MPLSTLDRRSPSLFKQETPAAVRLLVCAALSVFLMVADARFGVTAPVRAALAAALYPLEEAVLKPVRALQGATAYVRSLDEARAAQAQAERRLMAQTLRAAQTEALQAENASLRELLGLRERLTTQTRAAEVLYETENVYARGITLDKGRLQGIEPGSPVMDAYGVLGQVTRVYPFTSEVALVIDQDMVIPVANLRSGARAIAYGEPDLFEAGGLTLRYVQNDADVQAGDMLVTSGVDGVYPAGLPVAEVVQVDRRADSAFMRIHARAQAHIQGLRHVMVLTPLTRPRDAAAAPTTPAAADAPAAVGAPASAGRAAASP